jgi:hypothetical protein
MVKYHLLIWVFVPLTLFITYIASSAIPILYVMTFSVYYALAALMVKSLNRNLAMVLLLFITSMMIYSRLSPLSITPNYKDLTIISVYDIAQGNSVEQDFLILPNDWKLDRLLTNPDVEPVIRLLGDLDPENTSIYMNGVKLGSLSSLLIGKSENPSFNLPIYNYLLKFPKKFLHNTAKITLRIFSQRSFKLAYSSGVHPLPMVPHTRLIKANGMVEDISNQYYHRRFRFQIGIYLISNKYAVPNKDLIGGIDPLIWGVIL